MNLFVKILGKVGHEAKVIGKVSLPVALKVIQVTAPLAPEIFPGGAFLDVLPHVVPMLKMSIGMDGEEMNNLEMLAFTLIIGVLNSTVKNPAHKEALKSQMLGVADDIYMAYGMMPEARPTVDHGGPALAANPSAG